MDNVVNNLLAGGISVGTRNKTVLEAKDTMGR
jgi:hypothetical protein